jgi:hypothetical protein
VFIRDRQAGTTERVSIGTDSSQAGGGSRSPPCRRTGAS